MREWSVAASLFELFDICTFAGLTGRRIKRAPPPLKERGADISEPREGSSLDGYLAKLTISTAVTNVTGGPSLFGHGHWRPLLNNKRPIVVLYGLIFASAAIWIFLAASIWPEMMRRGERSDGGAAFAKNWGRG
jgi:hypothetical protein